MKYLLPSTLGLAVVLATLPVADAANKYEEMNYGPYLASTFNNAEGKNTFQSPVGAANKGLAIRVGPEKQGTLLFDTELLRMASGWTGGWLKMAGIIFDGAHGPNPKPADGAQVVFQTKLTPGWSKGDDFTDPRKVPAGPKDTMSKLPLGPLPKEWAKFKGHYLHGEKVILGYTVGTAPILELPGSEVKEGVTTLTRTFNVLAPGSRSNLLVSEGAEGTTASEENNVIVVKDDPKNAESRLVIAILGAPAGAKWAIEDSTRVVLKLANFKGNEAFKLCYWKGTQADLPKFLQSVQGGAKIENLRELVNGGPARWTETVTTKGSLGESAGNASYAVDTIEVPFDNPYKSWMRFGGLDFFKDGSLAVSTWSGDVWIVSGIDEKLENVKWKRYATGLFQPLGVKVVDEKVYVLGRDQITRLRDLNDDGEADLYEAFNNDVQVTPGFHEFALDLHTDPQGNFYFAKGGPVNPGGRGWGPLSEHNGCILKVSKDGSKLEVFATGVRAPNGMGVGPKGEVTVGDNQGTWVPACYVHVVKPGGFVSVTDLSHMDPLPKDFDPHICFFPMNVDNSSGAQVWVTSNKWGPFEGRLLHLSYGQSSLLGTLVENVNGVNQGGAFKFPFKFDSGICRARFSNKDGQLYVAGLKGWQTNGAKDAALQRVRYTGKPVYLPTALNVVQNGIKISFTNPVEAASAGDPESYSIEQWNYKWTKEYGSPDYKVSSPETKGRDTVEIKSVTLAPDRKSVFLEVPGIQPVMQMEIKMNINGEDGEPLPDKITNTINAVGRAGVASSN